MKKAKFFIIPNAITKSAKGSYWYDMISSELSEVLGINELKDEQEFIQLWYHSDDSENWQDHGIPEDLVPKEKKGEKFYMPSYLPLEMVKDMKEGDKIILNVLGTDVEFTAQQLGYRYCRFGKFENVMSELIP